MVLSANVLTIFSPNFSQFGLGAADLELEMHVLLAYFFTFEKQRKNKIWRHPSVKRLSHQGRNHRGINFLYNNRTVTVNMEQVQISHDGAR